MVLELKISGRMVKRVLLGLAAAGAVAGLVFLSLFLIGRDTALQSFVDERGYQAVFLSDGRVYLGRLTSASDEYYVLRDVFYLQQAPGAESDEENTQQVLPRMGDIHGPTGRMLIPKDAVVLVENLRGDGELSRTVDRLRAEARE